MNLTTRRKQYFSKMIFYFIALFLILEVFVQAFIIKTPKVHIVPGLGMIPVDNSVGVWGVEGYGVTHYLLNGEIVTPYTTGKSVVVLGDSYTEAAQVDDDNKFVSITENILNNRGVKVDLHNLGWSGRNIADYVYMAEHIKETYSPEIIVIQLGANDFDDAFNSSRPNYFVIENEEADLIHQDNYFQLSAQNLIRNSGLGSLFIYRFKNTLDELRFGKKAESANVDNIIDEYQFQARKSRQVLLAIKALRSAYPDIQIVFLVLPNAPIITEQSLTWSNENDEWIVSKIQEYSNDWTVYPIMEFKDLYTTGKIFPRGFSNTLPNYGHLNENGHQAVATALADALELLIK